MVEVDCPAAGGDPETVRTLTRPWGGTGHRRRRQRARAVAAIEQTSPRAPPSSRRHGRAGLGDGILLHADRRSSGSAYATRSVARCSQRRCSRAGRAIGRRRLTLLARGEIALASGNEQDQRRPDDRRLLAVHARSGRRGCDVGRAGLLHAQRGTACSGSATTSRSPGCASSATTSDPGSHACSERRGPIDVFDLAAQGLNMGDELHMRSQATGNLLIRDLAPARRRRRRGGRALPERQPPLLPEPDDEGRQVRLAGDRGLRRPGASSR